MVKSKPTETKHIGWHLFTFYATTCSISYRGVIRKETDKSFLLENPRVTLKVLKEGKTWLAVPAKAKPDEVLAAFNKVRDAHVKTVDEIEDALTKAQAKRFHEAFVALARFMPSKKTGTAAAG